MLWSNHVLGHAASGREDLARALAVAVNSHEQPCHAPWQPIPWLSWSLRLSAEFGAPAVPEALAIAIQLLNGRHSGSTPKPSRLGLAIECLDSLSLERRDVADVMLAAQLLPALPTVVPGADELEPDGTPAEHAILWGLTALTTGLDPQPWILFAAKLAEPVGLYQGLLDLADDAIRLPGDPPPRLAALLRILAGHETELGGLLEACAGALDDPRRIIECRRALANPQSFSCLTTQREHLLANARAALPSTVTAPGEAFLSSLSEAFVHVEHNLWLRLVMIKAQSQVIIPTAEPQVSVDAAVEYPALVQRMGCSPVSSHGRARGIGQSPLHRGDDSTCLAAGRRKSTGGHRVVVRTDAGWRSTLLSRLAGPAARQRQLGARAATRDAALEPTAHAPGRLPRTVGPQRWRRQTLACLAAPLR
jgi:hypothetical protein